LSSVSTVMLSPQGRLFNQEIARELADCQNLVFICGRYEGVDERVVEHLVSDEISIGDYLLSGGEVAAMAVVDCVIRLLPGVLGSEDSLAEDSHIGGLLEYPQYTRPAVYRGWAVPEILLSGDHGEIARWRRQQSLLRTAKRRPDLMEKAVLSPEDKRLLSEAFEIKS
jgi:tRNA (guanine37-N1)-methyltransferase